ncbi:cytidylyltransferase domain-containing protein [Candidatus Omnitrophota bacterium]
MYKNKKILALIPARSGSKRLPGKNVKLLAGKPLIAWTIEQAKTSKHVDKVIVSTDDKKIARISREYGSEVPFLRPQRLATDKAKSIDVILHGLDQLARDAEFYDIVILLQPTSPLRTSEDIDRAICLLFSKRAKAIISVYENGHRPLWSNTLPRNGSMKDFTSNKHIKGPYYTLNGAIYVSHVDHLRKKKEFVGSKTFAYIMPRERSIDIDDKLDFSIADQLLRSIK